MEKTRIILHADMNAFYASVECLHRPELKDKPVVVGGDEQARHGIVLAANIHAKKHKIKTAETLWSARKKCPGLVVLPPHYDKYKYFSEQAINMYYEYTDLIEPFGLDENYLDVTGSLHLKGTGEQIANELRERMKAELGLTISVGVSFTKVFAKLGSDMKKPDATTVIPKENYKKVVWPLPANEMIFIGRSTFDKLQRYGIYTIGDVAHCTPERLSYILGFNSIGLWEAANGLDNSPVKPLGAKDPVKSIGNSTTTAKDVRTPEEIKVTLIPLCESVAARLREHHLKCRTVQVSIRDNKLMTVERQAPLPLSTSNAQSLLELAFQLVLKNKGRNPIRMLGVRACQLEPAELQQLSLFNEFEAQEKQNGLEAAVDDIRSRFGHSAIKRAVMLTDSRMGKLNPKEDNIGVPYRH